MQTLVAGAEMMSIGMCKSPMPPSMQMGMRLKLKIIAAAIRRLRATTSATPEKNNMSHPSPVTRLCATNFASCPCSS